MTRSGETYATAQVLPVYQAVDFCVSHGVNLDDPICEAASLQLADIYTLANTAQLASLGISNGDDGAPFRVCDTSELGRKGAALHVDCYAMFMDNDGLTIETIIFIETKSDLIAAAYLLPLTHLDPCKEYTLVTIHSDNVLERFAQDGCASFVRGTNITTATGKPTRVEEIEVGDRILTREHGMQPVRWIGQKTVRAVDGYAPVKISEGILNNESDLFLGPNHRLFIFQRQDEIGAGRSEVMVKARTLINDDTVVQKSGGYVDYFQILFDQHEIIYAEGIPVESLYADTRLRPALPQHIQSVLREGDDIQDFGQNIEVGSDTVAGVDLTRLLQPRRRKASGS